MPSPADSRSIIQRGYRVPRTLLVRFNNDGLDETPELEGLLRARGGSQGGRWCGLELGVPCTSHSPGMPHSCPSPKCR